WGLEAFQDLGSCARFGDAGRLLDIEDLHHAILDERGIALRTGAESEARAVEIHPDLLGELGIAVGQEQHLLLATRRLLPGRKHERIVHGDAYHPVDALLFEVSALSMKLRGERARNGKQHATFAGEQVVNVSRRSGPAPLKDA